MSQVARAATSDVKERIPVCNAWKAGFQNPHCLRNSEPQCRTKPYLNLPEPACLVGPLQILDWGFIPGYISSRWPWALSPTTALFFVIVGQHFTFLWALKANKEWHCAFLILSQPWTSIPCCRRSLWNPSFPSSSPQPWNLNPQSLNATPETWILTLYYNYSGR